MKRKRSLPTLANPLEIALCSLVWDGELGFTDVTNIPMFIGAVAGAPAPASVKHLGSVFSSTLLVFRVLRIGATLAGILAALGRSEKPA
jgi:hypothetical protein